MILNLFQSFVLRLATSETEIKLFQTDVNEGWDNFISHVTKALLITDFWFCSVMTQLRILYTSDLLYQQNLYQASINGIHNYDSLNQMAGTRLTNCSQRHWACATLHVQLADYQLSSQYSDNTQQKQTDTYRALWSNQRLHFSLTQFQRLEHQKTSNLVLRHPTNDQSVDM